MSNALSDLLKGKSESEFSSYDIASKAHTRWSKKQFLEAARLFEAAARVATEEYKTDQSKPDQSLNYISRSGICFSQAGEFEKANPKLEEAILGDWVGSGLENDTNMIEWETIGDRPRFSNERES